MNSTSYLFSTYNNNTLPSYPNGVLFRREIKPTDVRYCIECEKIIIHDKRKHVLCADCFVKTLREVNILVNVESYMALEKTSKKKKSEDRK